MKTPQNVKISILERVATKEYLEELFALYEQGKIKRAFNYYEPTDKEIKLYAKWLDESITLPEIADLLAVSLSTVKNRFMVIGKKLVNKEISL